MKIILFKHMLIRCIQSMYILNRIFFFYKLRIYFLIYIKVYIFAVYYIKKETNVTMLE